MKLHRFSVGGSHVGWVVVPDDRAPSYLAMPGYTDIPPPTSMPPGHGAIMGPEGWTTALDLRGRAWTGPLGEVFVATEVGQAGPDGWVEMGFSRLGD